MRSFNEGFESHRSLAGAGSDCENPQADRFDRKESQADGLVRTESETADPLQFIIAKVKTTIERLQSLAKATWERFGSCLVYVILTVVVASVFAALGVLTLTASVTLLLVFLITYIVMIIVTVGWHKRNESHWELNAFIPIARTTVVVLLLLSSLITLSVSFRVLSSLKHRSIGGLETWKGLQIALISYVFCNICVCGRFMLTAVQKKCNYKEDWVYFTSKLRLAINCLCFVVASCLCVKVAPSEKRVTFYGLESWKWIVSLVSLLGGWYFIQAVTCLIILALETCQNEFWILRCSNISGSSIDAQEQAPQPEEKKSTTNGKSDTIKKYAVFMAKGLRTRINILLFFLLIVLTWIFYVKPRLEFEKLSEDTKNAINFIIPSFLSLSIAAVLLLIVKFLLLLWEAREVYRRLSERIFHAYIQIYILAQFCGSLGIPKKEDGLERTDAFIFEDELDPYDRISSLQRSQRESPTEVVDSRSQMTLDNLKFNLWQILQKAMKKVITYDILKRTADAFLEEMVESSQVADLCLKWQQQYCSDNDFGDRELNPNEMNDKIHKMYGYQIETIESIYLYQQLKAEIDSSTGRKVQYADLEKWMKKGHKNCLELGNTLAGAHEALGYLNKSMMVFVVAVCIIVWLLLTKIAKTDAIVLVASPLLAATFIFGDTMKTMFQGIVFAFAVHPFDVGDICIVEGNQLVVKRIGIWTTTFYRNDSKREEVLYPNSTLINTAIVKHKDILALDDSIQFSVDDFNLDERQAVKVMINRHMEDGDYPDVEFRGLVVDSSTMEVNFRHRKNFPDMSYSECLLKMRVSKANLSQAIATIIDNVKIYGPRLACEMLLTKRL